MAGGYLLEVHRAGPGRVHVGVERRNDGVVQRERHVEEVRYVRQEGQQPIDVHLEEEYIIGNCDR